MSIAWDESYPPSLFAPPEPPVIPVTAVTAGIPGAFVPANATIPADIAALRADAAVGNTGTNKPVAAWTVGQYVALGDASHAYWTGTLWQTGAAPVEFVSEQSSKSTKRKETRDSAADDS